MDNKRRPGDLIIDRYMPDASPEVREEARRRLCNYVRVLLRISMRLEQEQQALADSRKDAGRHKMGP